MIGGKVYGKGLKGYIMDVYSDDSNSLSYIINNHVDIQIKAYFNNCSCIIDKDILTKIPNDVLIKVFKTNKHFVDELTLSKYINEKMKNINKCCNTCNSITTIEYDNREIFGI